jgi:hypothetical protein
MARMYPLQPHFQSSGKDRPSGEQRLFELLRDALSDEIVVIHGLYWRRADGQTEEETDFVIIHPAYGFLVCEVKGGRNITFHDDTIWRGKQPMDPNPYHQACQGQRLLATFLRQIVADDATAQPLASIWAVWLMDRRRATVGLSPVYDALTLTQDDAQPEQVAEAILRHFARLAQPTPIAPDLIERIIDELWPMQSPRLTVARLLAGERQQFRRLHPDQAQVIQALLAQARGDVIGGAGTGKTVAAYEIAARLADAGLRVLYLCTHRNQASWLRGDLHHHPAFFLRQPHFAIHDVDDLLRQTIAVARGIAPNQVHLPQAPHTCAKALVDSLAAIRQRAETGAALPDLFTVPPSAAAPLFDAVLVDEAQDVAPELWPALHRLLADPEGGRFYTFGDVRQDEVRPHARTAGTPLMLTRNLRNARRIYAVMHRIYPDLPNPATLAPDHPEGDVIYVPISTSKGATEDARREAERAVLAKLLHELIDRQNVRPEQIMIISCRTQDSSKVTGKRSAIFHTGSYHIEGITLRQLHMRIAPGSVPVTTIQAAKGLESDIVILAEMDGLREGSVPRARVYIAVSRARSRLYILSHKRTFERDAFIPRPGPRGKGKPKRRPKPGGRRN